MSLRLVVADSMPCHVRGNVFLTVKTCSKALLAHSRGHGKSPCFSEDAFLRLIDVDARRLKAFSPHGAELLECAF